MSFVLPPQTWLSRLIDTIRTPERTNGLLLRSPSYPTRLWQLSHSSTSQADVTQAIDTSNAFCKLFVVITWLSTPMFCLISHFLRCSYFSLILARIHLFPVSLGSHERRKVIKKKKTEWKNKKKEEKKELYATIRSESIFSKAIAHAYSCEYWLSPCDLI